MIEGLRSAVRTLTVLPCPGRAEDISASLSWFPLVGLLLGSLLYLAGSLWRILFFGQWYAGAGLAMIGLEIWLTRGLHLDGLADWADSIGGNYQREKRLAIMKDTRVGTFGVLALILALGFEGLAFQRLMDSGSIIWIPCIFVLSRDMMVELITTLPYARPEGMGKAFVQGASTRRRFLSHAISVIFCLPFGPLGLLFFVLAWLLTWIFRYRCRHSFGGITGDLLGTANEIVEICLLIACALPGRGILCYTGWNWLI